MYMESSICVCVLCRYTIIEYHECTIVNIMVLHGKKKNYNFKIEIEYSIWRFAHTLFYFWWVGGLY